MSSSKRSHLYLLPYSEDQKCSSLQQVEETVIYIEERSGKRHYSQHEQKSPRP